MLSNTGKISVKLVYEDQKCDFSPLNRQCIKARNEKHGFKKEKQLIFRYTTKKEQIIMTSRLLWD